EPVVDFGEHRARVVTTIGIAQQPREAHGGAQFPPTSLLPLRDLDRGAERRLCLLLARRSRHQKQLTFEPIEFRRAVSLAGVLRVAESYRSSGQALLNRAIPQVTLDQQGVRQGAGLVSRTVHHCNCAFNLSDSLWRVALQRRYPA